MPLYNSSHRLPSRLSVATTVCLLLSACISTPGKSSLTTEQSPTLAGGRPLIIQRSAADQRTIAYVWQHQGEFVRIEAAEPGAESHQHPVSITGKQIKDALKQVRVGGADGAPLLSDEAMTKIATPLAQAFGQATANQEVSFAVAFRPPGYGRFISRRVTTGRLFRDANGVSLIIGLLHTPFEDRMLATGHRIAFTPGSRQRRIQEDWTLGSNDLVTHPVAGRGDWVQIDPMAWSGAAVTDKAETAPHEHPEPKTDPVDKYRSLEERLEVLKTLRDKGLISEENYQQKSRQILEDL